MEKYCPLTLILKNKQKHLKAERTAGRLYVKKLQPSRKVFLSQFQSRYTFIFTLTTNEFSHLFYHKFRET